MIDYGMPTLIECPGIERSTALCRELGLSFVELNMSFPGVSLRDLSEAGLGELGSRYGIYFTIHADESADVGSLNPRIAEIYREELVQTAILAAEQGIPIINMHMLRGVCVTLPERRTYIYAENESLYLDKMRQFRDEITAACGGSVKICVENTDGYELPFLQSALGTLLESPAFALTLDVGHDRAIGCSDTPIILSHKGRLGHMHIHDSLGKKVHLALGEGDADIASYIRLACENGCRAVLETKTLEALRKSVDYLAAMPFPF